MVKSKISWTRDQNGWTGLLYPCFSIFRDGKKGLFLDIMDARKGVKRQHRFIPVKSVGQGKKIAAGLLKSLLGEHPG